MSEQEEKKVPARNLERALDIPGLTLERAQARKADALAYTAHPYDKVKIFRRKDGTFDVVGYRKIPTADQKRLERAAEQVSATLAPKEREALIADAKENGTFIEVKKAHGQKSKDRKVSRKKERE